MLAVMMNKKRFLGKTYHYKKVDEMELEKNELNELREYLIKNDFPQSFIDLLEDLSIMDLLTIIESR